MNKTFSLFLMMSLVLMACQNQNKQNNSTDSPDESVNLMVADTIDGGQMLLGPINANGLNQEPFSTWLEENAAFYTPDPAVVESLKPLLKPCYIKVFMGTWCEDSQREVPALLKLLDMTNFDLNQLEIIAMTHDKDTPQGYEAGYDIEFIPTIMVYKDGAELNRIVEYTQETLEKDLKKIIQQEPYTPAYAD